MDDDFNTPIAMSVLFELAREVNTLRDTKPAEAAGLAALLKELGSLLGLLESDPDAYLQGGAETGDGLPASEVEKLIVARKAARANKDWKEADRLRIELDDAGIVIEDGPAGTTWRRK
jgi:cysteinyl-tRNA synthetase